MATTKTPTKRATKRTARDAAKTPRSTPKTATRAPKVVEKATRRAATDTKTGAVTARTTPRRAAPRNSGLDAIAELKSDHRTVEQLFKRFEKAGDGSHATKRAVVDAVIEELSRHAAIEELVMYPAIRQEVSRAEADVLEALEEHHSLKLSLRELELLDATHERFDPKMTVLIEHVRHHVTEEEQQLFRKVRTALGRPRLLELGAELREARPHVPTRPHPAAPDEPPANALIGGAVAVIDRARTVGKCVIDHVI